MAVQPAATQYEFQFLEERQIHDYFDHGGVEGLQAMKAGVRRDLAELQRLIDAIEGGESYSVGPDRVHAWWGWG